MSFWKTAKKSDDLDKEASKRPGDRSCDVISDRDGFYRILDLTFRLTYTTVKHYSNIDPPFVVTQVGLHQHCWKRRFSGDCVPHDLQPPSQQTPNPVSMLGQRRRRWANMETGLGECPVFAESRRCVCGAISWKPPIQITCEFVLPH